MLNETGKEQSHLISVEAVSASFLLKCILTLPCDSHPERKLVSAVLLLLLLWLLLDGWLHNAKYPRKRHRDIKPLVKYFLYTLHCNIF